MTTPPEVLAAMVARLRERSEDQLLRESTVEEHLCAALAAAEALGWELKPKAPTYEMLRAAGATPNGVTPRGGIDWLGRMLPRYWAAMYAAAPKVSP